MAEIVNGKCHAEKAPLDSPPLIQQGKIVIQCAWSRIGWMVCSALTLVAMGVSFWLISKHLRWYTNKHQQRYIVRILFMVPLYALISTASYFWWNHSTPLLLIRDCYESTVLTAFFYLLLLYVSPDPHEQKEIFRKNGLSRANDRERRRRGEHLQKWMFPMSFIRWKPEDGLYFLQLMKWGVLQYCVVRPGTTLAAVILDYAGLYCEDSWSLGWGHIYITLVVSISVSIAMYCLIQLYFAVKVELAPQKPLLKLFAIKAVVFLTFWQATLLSVFTLFGIVKDTPYMTANNINIGIGAILETTEMALFAILHIKAFSYKPYMTADGPTPRWRALVHAMNFKETGRELWAAMVYMLYKSRGREVDTQARREAALETVFGRSRYAIVREANVSDSKAGASEKMLGVTVEIEEEVRIGNERQWIGLGDDYIYGLGYQAKRQRERSEGLESQIEKELAMRGYTLRGRLSSGGAYAPIVDAEAAPVSGHQRTQGSWWRRMYNRLSQPGPDADAEATASPARRSSSRRRSKGHTAKLGAVPLMADVQEDDYNDPPPPSAIRTYRESRNNRQGPRRKAPPTLDPPLLFTSFGDVPSFQGSSPDARNDASRLVGAPTLLTPPLASPSTQSMQADSFLDRAFAASVEPGSSVDLLTAPPSSQSHHTHVRLGAVPAIATSAKPQPQIPVVVHPSMAGSSNGARPSTSPPSAPSSPPTAPPISPMVPPPATASASPRPHYAPQSPPPSASPERTVPSMWTTEEPRGRRRSHRRDSAQYYPQPGNFSPPPQSPLTLSPLQQSPQSPHLQRATAAYSRGARRNSATLQYSPQHTPQYTAANRYTPTRDRIVLPAPLAAMAPGGSGSPARDVFSSPTRYSPTSPPPRDPRRWSNAAHTPPHSTDQR
ncbi:organic solute transporter Ostalpha-domain-containing protein [Cerioporus squamosus]|nr:organic solute transporter Ostalpha-domain-containing protein [Cerioporus squamosus]